MKPPKFIKADFRTSKPALPKIPDLILNFASDSHVYTITVPADQMGQMAVAFCKLMGQHNIKYRIEERIR